MKLPKFRIERPAVKRARGRSKKQRGRISVACTHCRKRKMRCEPLGASNNFEPDRNTCVQCTMKGEECSRSQTLRVGSVALSYYQQVDFFNLPNILPQPLPEDYGYFEPFSQQHDSSMTQPQFLAEPSSSPSSRATLDADELLGYPEMSGWSLATEEHFEKESYVRGTTTVEQEQTETETETETIGLGIYIPDSQLQYPNVVDSLPSPMPARLVEASISLSTLTLSSWYDPYESSHVAHQPLTDPREGADYAQQPSEHPLGGQMRTPFLEWQTTADPFLQQARFKPWHEMNVFDQPLNSGFHDGGSPQDIHQTTYDEPQWFDHTHMSYLSFATSDDSWELEDPTNTGLFGW